MNQTGDMFEAPPKIARRRDPVTSKVAALEYDKHRRKKDVEVMYDLIMTNPGLTAAEYGQLLLERGVKPLKAIRMPTKRISDLHDAGRIIIGSSRKCTQSGRTVRTYYAQP